MTAANQAVVERALAAFAAGDLDTGIAQFHPDIRMHEATSLPFGGTHRGLDGLKDMLATMGATRGVRAARGGLATGGPWRRAARREGPCAGMPARSESR